MRNTCQNQENLLELVSIVYNRNTKGFETAVDNICRELEVYKIKYIEKENKEYQK